MRLSEMREVLTTRGIQLTRSLGQNFLHDANQLRRIVGLAELNPGDKVLEIGPGLGPLTEHLLTTGAEVLAIEKDARLAAVMAERFRVAVKESTQEPPGEGTGPAGCRPGRPTRQSWPPERGHSCPPVQPSDASTGVADPHVHASHEPGDRLTLVHADALRVIEEGGHDWSGWKLVANLPYSVASPILVELAWAEHSPERLVATLQLEVVRRLMAQPGSKDYGVLTLLLQLRYEPRGSFKIPADCFFPAPDVDSGCIALVRRAEEPLSPAARGVFRRVVKRAFSERRKKALKLLKFDWPAAVLETAWSDLGLDPLVRAENLSRAHFIELTRRLTGVDPNLCPKSTSTS